MLYVIFGLDAPDAGPRRLANRPAHLERIKALHEQGRMAIVGPLPKIDAPSLEAGAAGSLIVAEFDSLEAARAWVAADPFTTAGVYASVEVHPFFKLSL
ncbi:MAG: YciI family protein [Panacagrimonas sp.]